MIECISFNFDIISYKIILYVLYLSRGFYRDIALPKFVSIYDNWNENILKECNVPF
jgi:hypothetical protein